MALSSHSEWASMNESSLKDWEWKAGGGFGDVYKARHIEWRWDVAIKVLKQYEGTPKILLREAELMRKGGSNFVIRVQGVFKGHVPNASSIQFGLVMEFMERGSLASLQETLNNPPQKTLVFRMAHQVALGMNYLHSLTPPLLHLDLKPGNVLLDKDLNVKITDFGLSKIYSSMTSKRSGHQPGTIKYMPPEALTSISYKAIGAYDVYSYGILLWSIVMWKEPYEDVNPARIEALIPMGNHQRPSVTEMNPEQDPGLEKLKELMQKCWDQEPQKRPQFRECIDLTEDYKEHEITDAVHQVQKELAQQEDEITQPSVSYKRKSMTASSRMLTEPLVVIQDVVDGLTSTESATGAVSPNGESKKASSSVIAAHPPAQDPVGLTDKEKVSPNGESKKASSRQLTDKEKADFVIQNKATLIQKVPTVMAIVESLGLRVHEEIYAEITSQKVPMEQMRILYRKVLIPLGKAVRAAFYDALEEHQPSLLLDLGSQPTE